MWPISYCPEVRQQLGWFPTISIKMCAPRLLDPSVMGPPIVWLASQFAAGVHDERIVVCDFADWLSSCELGT